MGRWGGVGMWEAGGRGGRRRNNQCPMPNAPLPKYFPGVLH
ncbi:MAG: hypothetical protein RMY29_005640 [Nostoc sp. CreGUA01]|nr:hypothetical protein [Nostoc sp. CreGUA01]